MSTKKRISKIKRTKRKNKKAGASKKKNIVPYANEIEEAAYFLSLNNNSKKNKNNKRKVKTKRNKRSRTKKNRRTKRTKKNRRTKRNTRKTRERQRGGMEAGGMDPATPSLDTSVEQGMTEDTPPVHTLEVNGVSIPVFMTEEEARGLSFLPPGASNTRTGLFRGTARGDRENLKKGDIICVKVDPTVDIWRVAKVNENFSSTLMGASPHTVIFGDKTEPEQIYLSKNSEDTDIRKRQWLIYRPDIALAKDLQQKSESATLQANIRENSRNEQIFSQQAKQHLSRGEINEAIINFKNAISLLIRLIIDDPQNKEKYNGKIEEYKGRLGFLNELREISGEQRQQLTETQRDLQQLSIILQRDKEIDDNMALAQLAKSLSQPKSNEAFQRLQDNLLREELDRKLPKVPKGTG